MNIHHTSATSEHCYKKASKVIQLHRIKTQISNYATLLQGSPWYRPKGDLQGFQYI